MWQWPQSLPDQRLLFRHWDEGGERNGTGGDVNVELKSQ